MIESQIKEKQIAQKIEENTQNEENEDIDLLNFDLPNNEATDNKENKTPIEKNTDDYDILNLDLGLNSGPVDQTQNQQNNGGLLNVDVDLTPLPPAPKINKKMTLDDIDEFNLFSNLKN